MAHMCYKAKAPGSLMLMGEYAVLAGYPCLVTAIDRTVSVTLTPEPTHRIVIKSMLGELTTPLEKIPITPPFEYVLACLKQHEPYHTGFMLEIESTLPAHQGLGSSAAVTVALLHTLCALHQKKITQKYLFKEALKVIHIVQGKGSGADVAASLYGGVIAFTPAPFSVTPLTPRPNLTVVYSGYKTTTTEALKRFSPQSHNAHLITTLGTLSEGAITAWATSNWNKLGKLMQQAQTTLHDLGVSSYRIDEIVMTLCKHPNIRAAKISGSGLGDCVVGLGKLPLSIFGDAQLPIQICNQGAQTC